MHEYDLDLDISVIDIIRNENYLKYLSYVSQHTNHFISTSYSLLPRAVWKGEQDQDASVDTFIGELSTSLRELLCYEPSSSLLVTGANSCDPKLCLSMHACMHRSFAAPNP